MKKRSILICICAVALTLTACNANKTEKNDDPAEEAITTDAQDEVLPAKEKEGSDISFRSGGRDVPDNGRYPLIFDEIYFDQICFSVETDGNVTSLREGGQALLSYVDEEKKERTNDELLDYFIMDEADMFFNEHITGASVVDSYKIVSQEDVTVGDFDCTHYIIKLACTYPDYPETSDYSCEAYCFHFGDYPMVMAGVVRDPDSYAEKSEEYMETTRSDLSNNLLRMVSTVSAEK